MKYKSETKDKWAEEMNDDELIKLIIKDKGVATSFFIFGFLIIIGSLIHYTWGFIGVGLMLVGVVGHIRFRYLQIIKLIKNKKEDEK